MSEGTFEWDAKKAASNIRDHRVSFEEAKTVWDDPSRIVDPDLVHSTETEYREMVLGLSEKFRLMVIIFTERHETIRIISARRANQAETRRYTGEN